MPLFQRAAVATDLHYGRRQDSELHNRDVDEFVDWFCKQAVDNDCDCILVLGDTFDNQVSVGLLTLDYALRGIKKIASLGLPVYWLVGNHDKFYKHSRSVHWMKLAESIPNITVINDITVVGDVLLCPYLIGSEFLKVPDVESTYVFGHFELPLFLLNDMREFPDNGGLHSDHFLHPKMVFSGHFHKRQVKINKNGIPVWYIGNAFPMDFNDVGDTQRGCMILEWGGTPQFLNWDNAPTYFRLNLSKILAWIEADEIGDHLNSKSVVHCTNDIQMEHDDLAEVKVLLSQLVREIQIFDDSSIPDHSEGDVAEEISGSVDVKQVVVDSLRNIDNRGSSIDNELLVDLFLGN